MKNDKQYVIGALSTIGLSILCGVIYYAKIRYDKYNEKIIKKDENGDRIGRNGHNYEQPASNVKTGEILLYGGKTKRRHYKGK
jgi:hypothetical protein